MIQEKKLFDIVIDFDGTVCVHKYPNIGEDIGAVPVLKRLVEEGHGLILFTMRDNKEDRRSLDEAVDWFHNNDINLYGIQKNPTQNIWTTSPKAFGQIIIDDAALGCPLIYPTNGDRPYVDWVKVEQLLVERGVLSN
jgi:hypothetical protein